ncbi:MAG: ABC transporter permease subunit [Desulfurococcales archaeon]|nr:ABC transporter permease subunit [Desulfurococcales archaeon]MCE4629626.1 ABC transporter permease subunit [Desulfurococcales archaeon]
MKEKLRGTLGYLAATGIFLAVWHTLSYFSGILPGIIPSISYLAGNLGIALSDTVITLENTLAGFMIALVLAMVLAWLASLGGFVEDVVKSFNVLVQSVSALVWALLFLIIYGFTSRLPAVSVAAATAFPILLSGTLKGFEVARSEYGELSRILGLSRLGELLNILAPASVPFIVASGRSALGAALRISVVAEAFGASGGIGYRLWLYYQLHDYEGFMAWALLLVTLMVVLDKLVLERLEAWSRKWME